MKQISPFYYEHHKYVDIVFSLIVTILCIMIFCSFTLPLIRDLPYFISKKYEVIEGYAVNQAVGMDDKAKSDLSITIKDIKSGEEVELLCYYTEIHKGDYIKAYYLPNSHAADIVEQAPLGAN